MSVPEFAVHAGLYTTRETEAPEFRLALRGIHREDYPEGVTDQELHQFWTTIGDGDFRSSVPASSLCDPFYRYLHRIISRTLIGRYQGHEKVNKDDLFILYCLIQRREANLATILLSSFTRPLRSGSRLALGIQIAQIAANLRVFLTYPTASLTRGPDATFVTYNDLVSMGICPRDGPHRFIDVRERQAAPEPQPEDAEGDAQPQPVPRPFRQERPRARVRPQPAAVDVAAPPPPPPPPRDVDAILARLEEGQVRIVAEQTRLRESQDRIEADQTAQRVMLQMIIDHFQIPMPLPPP